MQLSFYLTSCSILCFSEAFVVPTRTAIPFVVRTNSVRVRSRSNNNGPLDWIAEQFTGKENTKIEKNSYLPDGLQELAAFTQPVQDILDQYTSGWALSYADLSPDSPKTLPGQAFLATNLAYGIAGVLLTMQGNAFFGLLTDLTAIASFNYHYCQLEASGNGKAPNVRLALLLDYVLAFTSIFVALYYVTISESLPLPALESAGIGLFFLGLCWVYETGRPYMIFHSLWHLFSAWSGYLIGTHYACPMGC